MKASIYERRLALTKEAMVEKGVELLYLCPSVNMFYLTGVRREPHFGKIKDPRAWLTGLLIGVDSDPVILVPKMHADYVQASTWVKDIRIWTETDDSYQWMRSTLSEFPHDTIAICEEMPASSLLNLQKLLVGASFSTAHDIVGRLRMIKDDEELVLMEKAAQIADKVICEIIDNIQIGISERELAWEIENRMRRHGAEGLAFSPIVRCGTNSATLGYPPSEKRTEPNQPLQLDIGCVYEGYCSDITRTVYIGEPTLDFAQVYDIVLRAQEAGVNAACNGITGKELDAVARDIIAREGFGEFFVHRTGHGIGLESNEPPYVSRVSETTLKTGMVVTIEPGIYLKGRFGVRIEDTVVVDKQGGRRLNNVPHHLWKIG